MKIYDVVVIGAGPAGLMAARTLNRKKIDFLAIDKKTEIGFPLKCGGGVREDGFVELFKSADYDFINKAKHLEVRAGKTKRIINFNYLVLDRPKFEKWLSIPFKNKIKLNTECKDIKRKKGHLEIKTNKGIIKTRMAILANGCNYSIQKKFKLIGKKPLTIPCYGGIFTNHNLNPKTLYLFFDDKNLCASWIFPEDKNKANIGIAVYPYFQKENIKDLFKKYLLKHAPKAKQISSYGGIFPNSCQIKKTYADGLLVCGDAAGQVYCGAGEGIYFALSSGKLAGITAIKAVRGKNFSSGFLKRYEKSWKKKFGRQLKASMVFNYILAVGFKYKKLEKLFSLPKEKDLMNLFWRGKVPLKARIAYIVAKISGVEKKKNIPLLPRVLWRIYRAFR